MARVRSEVTLASSATAQVPLEEGRKLRVRQDGHVADRVDLGSVVLEEVDGPGARRKRRAHQRRLARLARPQDQHGSPWRQAKNSMMYPAKMYDVLAAATGSPEGMTSLRRPRPHHDRLVEAVVAPAHVLEPSLRHQLDHPLDEHRVVAAAEDVLAFQSGKTRW